MQLFPESELVQSYVFPESLQSFHLLLNNLHQKIPEIQECIPLHSLLIELLISRDQYSDTSHYPVNVLKLHLPHENQNDSSSWQEAAAKFRFLRHIRSAHGIPLLFSFCALALHKYELQYSQSQSQISLDP